MSISDSVAIIVDGEGGISDASCDCPRGSWLCSHMAATAIYANKKGLSKTDLPNSWISRPKRNATIESKTMADFFLLRGQSIEQLREVLRRKIKHSFIMH